MPDDILERAARAMEGITEGPWSAHPFARAPATPELPELNRWKVRPIQHSSLGSLSEPDARFITAAPGLVRDLLALVRERDKEIERLRGALDRSAAEQAEMMHASVQARKVT